MSGKKEFATSFLGFNQHDVNAYLEKLISDFDVRIHEKNHEINELNLSVIELNAKKEQISELTRLLSDQATSINNLKSESLLLREDQILKNNTIEELIRLNEDLQTSNQSKFLEIEALEMKISKIQNTLDVYKDEQEKELISTKTMLDDAKLKMVSLENDFLILSQAFLSSVERFEGVFNEKLSLEEKSDLTK